MSMMYAIDVIDWPSFPFLEVVRDITYGVTYSSFFFFYTIDNIRRLGIYTNIGSA